MEQLLEIRDRVLSIYSQYEPYLSRVIRFIICLLCVVCINGRIGYEESLTGVLPAVLIALICTLLPGNAAAVVLALVIVIHLFSLAMEAAVVGGCILLLLLLIYFRFAPEDTVLLLLYPSCSAIGLPYALPVAGGLFYGPASGCTVAVGVIVDRFLRFIRNSETTLAAASTDTDDIISRFQYLIDGVLSDRLMQVEVVAVIIGAAVVYAVRRRAIPYAWIIASAAGAVTQMVILLIGAILFDTDLAILTTFLGVLGAFAIGCVISFVAFNLDYSRMENTQFEDDEYYYYVKAVPKNTYARPKRTVKTINTNRGARETGARRGTAERYYTDDDRAWDTESFDAAEVEQGVREGYADDAGGDTGDVYGNSYGSDSYDHVGYDTGSGYDAGYARDAYDRDRSQDGYDDYGGDGY